MENIKLVYKTQEAVIKLFNDNYSILFEAKCKTVHGKEVPTMSAQVAGGHTIVFEWTFIVRMCWFLLLLPFLNTWIRRWQRKIKFLDFQGLFYPIKQEAQI